MALNGYDYQLLFSCYLVLVFLDEDNKKIKFEGIEDIDSFRNVLTNNEEIEHIQLKYSRDRQDASFFDGILKNFLEVYLTDNKNSKRYFKLVYDLEISKGNLSKLISKDLDAEGKEHWDKKILKIRNDNPEWKWDNFDFDTLLKQLRFEKKNKSTITTEIQKLFIERFDITSGNESLFINTLFYNIYQKAKNREEITLSEINKIIQETKDAIARGYINPAHLWIEKIQFDKLISETVEEDYFEGKKATPKHIANHLPVRREIIESKIKESIESNTITVIKSSSGQGKTTLAWQVAYEMKNEYSVYMLKWCADSKEIGNIVEFLNSRLKIGEKLLIVIDNLSSELQEWNKMAQELSNKLVMHYKLLITTREEDWYSYGGDQSNLGKMKIIDIYMDIDQAQSIFKKFQEKNKIHKDIDNWQSAWEKVAERKLLIEYVYLITHGEMIEERIDHQIRMLNQSKGANIKLELLRLIAAADVMGVKIKGYCLIKYIRDNFISEYDIDEILRSIESEYFINIGENDIEGLHPVRSQHLFDRLHKYNTKLETIKKLIELIEETFIAQLFSKMPEHIGPDKDEFYVWVVNKVIDKPYSFLFKTIQGVISGSILKYFNDYKHFFDDADKHGGLFLFITEIYPWNTEIHILKDLLNIDKENVNIKYILSLTESIPRMTIKETDLYIYAYYLYNSLKDKPTKRLKTDFSRLSEWLMKIETSFNILKQFKLAEDIWNKRTEWDFEELALLFYLNYLYDTESYLAFVNAYKSEILSFLKVETETVKIYEMEDNIYLNYILMPNDIKNANTLSVDRINKICRFLPIYSKYCTKAIQPQINRLKDFNKGLPDNSFKEMPIGNVKLSFNVDFNTLWQKSILSYYEFPSIYHWQKYWVDIRKETIEFIKMNTDMLESKLKNRRISNEVISSIDSKRIYICDSLIRELPFPHEKRPFEEASKFSEFASKIKHGYFSAMRNYLQQFFNILLLENTNNKCNLAMINIKDALGKLSEMQNNFNWVCSNSIRYFYTTQLESEEYIWVNRLINLNEFYIQNAGKQYVYNRQILKSWIINKEKSLVELIYSQIDEIERSGELKLIKPQKLIKEQNFTTLIIGVNHLNLEDEKLLKLFYFSSTLITVDIDFIAYMFTTDMNNVLPYGLQVSKHFVEQLKKCIDEDTEFPNDGYFKPIPIEIDQNHLEAFNDEYIVEKINRPKYIDGFGTFVLQLWKYSQYKEHLDLSDAMERAYFIDVLNSVKDETKKLLGNFKKHIEPDLLNELSELNSNVLEEKCTFNNADLNLWYEKVLNDQ